MTANQERLERDAHIKPGDVVLVGNGSVYPLQTVGRDIYRRGLCLENGSAFTHGMVQVVRPVDWRAKEGDTVMALRPLRDVATGDVRIVREGWFAEKEYRTPSQNRRGWLTYGPIELCAPLREEIIRAVKNTTPQAPEDEPAPAKPCNICQGKIDPERARRGHAECFNCVMEHVAEKAKAAAKNSKCIKHFGSGCNCEKCVEKAKELSRKMRTAQDALLAACDRAKAIRFAVAYGAGPQVLYGIAEYRFALHQSDVKGLAKARRNCGSRYVEAICGDGRTIPEREHHERWTSDYFKPRWCKEHQDRGCMCPRDS